MNGLEHRSEKREDGSGSTLLVILSLAVLILAMAASVCYGISGIGFVLFWLREIVILALFLAAMILFAFQRLRKLMVHGSKGSQNAS